MCRWFSEGKVKKRAVIVVAAAHRLPIPSMALWSFRNHFHGNTIKNILSGHDDEDQAGGWCGGCSRYRRTL